jgi:anthranilate phosphoribosyltransferase
VETVEENAETLFKTVNGKSGRDDAKTDIVLVNAAAGLIVSGKTQNFTEGVELAGESISSGAAYMKLKELVQITCGDASRLERLEHKYA